MNDPSVAVTRAEAAASAGDALLKSGCGIPSMARFQKGVVSPIQVLCDQMSRMAFGVIWNSAASFVATVGPGYDLDPSLRKTHTCQMPLHVACAQLVRKEHRRGNGTYLQATKMTTAWSRVSLPLTARTAARTSNCQQSCNSSIDQSRSPPVCALVRSQLSVVGRDLHMSGAAGSAARATDVEPDKSWSSLGLLLGMSRLSSSCRSSENARRACDGAGALCHRSLAHCPVVHD